jgi:hypothetical protein
MRSRKSAPETHKRMLFLATLVLLDAAILRMTWLPTFGIDNIAVTHSYQLLLIVPALAYDVLRTGRIHHAYVAGLSLIILTTIAAGILW